MVLQHGNYAIKDFEEAEYALMKKKSCFSNKELSANVNALWGCLNAHKKKYKKSNAARCFKS
jgi:hypothetical protein